MSTVDNKEDAIGSELVKDIISDFMKLTNMSLNDKKIMNININIQEERGKSLQVNLESCAELSK